MTEEDKFRGKAWETPSEASIEVAYAWAYPKNRERQDRQGIYISVAHDGDYIDFELTREQATELRAHLSYLLDNL
jgi:uncharacterized protein (DUF58 family)